MRKSRRRLFVIIAIITLLTICGILEHNKRPSGPTRITYVTSRPGEPRGQWWAHRVVWTYLPGIPNYHSMIQDVLAGADRLYYVCECEVGCVEKASGRLVWRYPFLTAKQATANGSPWMLGCVWHMAKDDQTVYACECQEQNVQATPSPTQYRLCAVDARTGKLAWERRFTLSPRDAPTPAGGVLLLPAGNGIVTALRRSDGNILWQRRMGRPVSGLSRSGFDLPPIKIQISGDLAVAWFGSGNLVGFRIADGKPLWTSPEPHRNLFGAAGGYLQGFALMDGVVYALRLDDKLAAIRAATGKQLWIRPTGGVGPSSSVSAQGDTIFAQLYNTLTALRRTDGKTVWSKNAADFSPPDTERQSWGNQITATMSDRPNTLFAVVGCKPVVDGVERILRSVPVVDTIISLDPATGHEKWRWQPETGDNIQHLIAEGRRFYFSNGPRLKAVEEGVPDPLPTGRTGRGVLARRMMFKLCQWPEPRPSLFERLAAHLPGHLFQPNRADDATNGSSEAELTLIRLGRDSTPVLLDYIREIVKRQAANLPPPGNRVVYFMNGQPYINTAALDTLFDIGDPAAVPPLAGLLDGAKMPAFRDALAETLIRWGDVRALGALFRYAQAAAGDSDARQDALYFVCRFAPEASASPATLGQAEITAWLTAQLTAPKSPAWLRRFAKFELLNGRGEAARQAAFATFKQERSARLMPVYTVLRTTDTAANNNSVGGFPIGFQPDSISRDSTGRWWAAFHCSYLRSVDEIWFVQSGDQQRWNKPAFGVDLARLCTHGGEAADSVDLTCHGDRLRLNWTELIQGKSTRKFSHHTEIRFADLYRDSDHDGIPDLVEKEIGTDPANPDTNGNGIPDGSDKNPLYRPHPLTDQEGIYQTTIEALCQFGRATPPPNPNRLYDSLSPVPFGCGSQPLILPVPPGSKGIEVLGHSGMVLYRPLKPRDRRGLYFNKWNPTEPGVRFLHPHIGFDGLWKGPAPSWPGDESADVSTTKTAIMGRESPPAFRDYFPFVLSPDGKRARVGVEILFSAYTSGGKHGFDVEVRKIDGRWLPVQCRAVDATTGRMSGEAHVVVPMRVPH